jgi:site-specific recombinase XerD
MEKSTNGITDLIFSALSHLRKQSFSQSSIEKYSRAWQKVSNYMKSLNLSIYNVAVGEAFMFSTCGQNDYNYLTKEQKQLQRKITYLTEFQETGKVNVKRKNADPKFEGLIGKVMSEYMTHITSLGYSIYTVQANKIYLSRFLTYLNETGILSIDEINSIQLIIFVKKYGFSKPSVKHEMLSVIKQFLRYIYKQRLCQVDYSNKVPRDNFIRQPKLPSVYSSDEIGAMIQTIDRGNPKGKRDYAIVVLAARLGLRASDICGLMFENLHWQQCLIVLNQQKTGKKIELPLTDEVGNAIIDYLKYGRPLSEKGYVFLSLTPPYDRMTNINLATIISTYLKNAGINYNSRRHGTHCLRHSLSAILLKDKVPLPVISEVLGHKDIGSTMYYLRIDIDSLMQCALEVPSVAATFYTAVS